MQYDSLAKYFDKYEPEIMNMFDSRVMTDSMKQVIADVQELSYDGFKSKYQLNSDDMSMMIRSLQVTKELHVTTLTLSKLRQLQPYNDNILSGLDSLSKNLDSLAKPFEFKTIDNTVDSSFGTLNVTIASYNHKKADSAWLQQLKKQYPNKTIVVK